jgi:hypothetical protein
LGAKKRGGRGSKLSNAGQRLVGSHKQHFDDIPDSISTYSKITGARNKFKKSPKKSSEVTAKPNNIIMKDNLATIRENNFTGLPEKRQITDKPNNIRAPIGYADMNQGPMF